MKMADILSISDAYSEDNDPRLKKGATYRASKLHVEERGRSVIYQEGARRYPVYPMPIEFETTKSEGLPRQIIFWVPQSKDNDVGLTFYVSEKDWEGMKDRFGLVRVPVATFVTPSHWQD
jgi:hypothetical protein